MHALHPAALATVTLRFPAAVASDAQLFDRVLNTMIEYGARGELAGHFTAWLAHDVSDAGRDARVLRETYWTMRRLQEEGRNHIRGYVARNLACPVWLAPEAQKAAVVIGNPPWMSHRYMHGDFKAHFQQESRAANLWVSGKGATQQDLSSYFYLRGRFVPAPRTAPRTAKIFRMAPPSFHAGWSWSILSHRREGRRRSPNFYSCVGVPAARTGHRGKLYQHPKERSKNDFCG